MSAPHIELADAVTASLATLAGGAYTPVRAYLPRWREDELTATPECVVVPSNVETERIDRSNAQDGYTIDVGFAAKLAAQTREEIDALSTIVDAAFRHLRPTGAGDTMATAGGLRCRAIAAAYKAIFDPDRFAAKTEGDASGVFLAVFSITYRAFP